MATCHVILGGSINIYHDLRWVRKWPLQLPPLLPSLWKGSGTFPRGYEFSRTLTERGEDRSFEFGLVSIIVASIFILQCVCCSIGCQILKCQSHPPLHWLINCPFSRSHGIRERCGVSDAIFSIWTIMTRVCHWLSASSSLLGIKILSGWCLGLFSLYK